MEGERRGGVRGLDSCSGRVGCVEGGRREQCGCERNAKSKFLTVLRTWEMRPRWDVEVAVVDRSSDVNPRTMEFEEVSCI